VKNRKKLKSNNGIDIDFCSWNMFVVCCSASLFQADLSIGKWPSLVQKVGYIHSVIHIRLLVQQLSKRNFAMEPLK